MDLDGWWSKLDPSDLAYLTDGAGRGIPADVMRRILDAYEPDPTDLWDALVDPNSPVTAQDLYDAAERETEESDGKGTGRDDAG
ncbi:hypothetical protein J2Y69_000696 [Microbacterium resistens]|uniref:DUF2795 domain-containing protein n=1 Tax=Microbacterium resistens TaxID=156977 RepID=A0ABU1S921_9MICO|nr:hypothetical protein [Microbacterium resistens]MDR6866111.1 hypothetical protein [Microbacterium resistens]